MELYIGIPIFPGTSGYDQLYKIFDVLGLPSQEMIHRCQHRNKYFIYEGNQYRFKTIAEYEKDTQTKLPEIKKYHNIKNLADIKKIYRRSTLRAKASKKDEDKLEEFYDL